MADQESKSAETAGQILKAAREQAGLSLDEVAEQLNLVVSVVVALEENNYSKIREGIFVRGYLRNYANLLNLPTQPLINFYADNLRSQVERKAKTGASGCWWHRLWVAVTSGGKGALLVIAFAGLVSWMLHEETSPMALERSSNGVTVDAGEGVSVVSTMGGGESLAIEDKG